ncbi:MAG: GSCFA domain-containing protein [Bacteroidota bacterium]
MFKLAFDIPESKEKINIKDLILMIGSCFSDEIGSRLSQSKFNTLRNPFGTVYNPYSIFKLLFNDLSEDFVSHEEIYLHWDTHGAISGLSKNKLFKVLEDKRRQTQSYLENGKWLVITLGTAIVYELKKGRIVANCHKVSADHFTKRFLSKQEIVNQFKLLNEKLYQTNPHLNIVFTVSPVRHIKDGLIENNRSKAILIDAVHEIVHENSQTSYFPSYEILIDELRDYRFYAKDMAHPSDQAIDYVWQQFKKTYLDPETQQLTNDLAKLISAVEHRPFHPTSNGHQRFLKNTLQKLQQMNEKLDVNVEIEQIRSQII